MEVDELVEIKKIRAVFPVAGATHLGGTSDGVRYRTLFGARTLSASYKLLRQFLTEQGYENLIIPADAEELSRFRHPPGNKAIKLFEEYGYQHFPVKIIFHPHMKKEHTLILYLYNEQVDDVLLQFHGVAD